MIISKIIFSLLISLYCSSCIAESSPRLIRLGEIFDKIDTNLDKELTEDELADYIVSMSENSLKDSCKSAWEYQKLNENSELSWDQYLELMKNEEVDIHTDVIETERKRFMAADENGDNSLGFAEFCSFIQPESNSKMIPLLVDEAIHEIDTNGDKRIDIDEYLNDFGIEHHDNQSPDWIEEEKNKFHSELDKDNDGYLNQEEVREWIYHDPRHDALNEAKTVLEESDDDKNGKLSKEELLNHLDVAQSSHITDYGQALGSDHDEL